MSLFVLPNTKEDILKKVCKGCSGAPLTSIVRKTNTMEVNGAPELLCFPHSSEYLPLCSAEQRHSYRFGTTWGWVNDDRIFIFGWTIPLRRVGCGTIHVWFFWLYSLWCQKIELGWKAESHRKSPGTSWTQINPSPVGLLSHWFSFKSKEIVDSLEV